MPDASRADAPRDEASATADPAQTPADWLRTALLGPPTRGQYVVAVLLLVLGLGLATQIRLTRTDPDFSGQRREELVQLLDLYSAARDRAQGQIDDLQQTRGQLLSSSTRRRAAVREQRRRLVALGVLAGATPAHGPGITLTIQDPSRQLTATTMLNTIMELRDAGAEAIEVNDTARVVASSYVSDATGGGLVIDGVALRPPYVVDAIGDAQTLEVAVRFRGGIADEVAAGGGTVAVRASDDVRVESLHEIKSPEYARPDE